MADQISMDDILNPPKQDIKETVKEAVKEVIDAPVQVETKETKDPVAAQLSIRKRHRDKEQDAQGRVRDPETGQYAAKQEKEAEVKEEKKEEVVVKQDVKQEEKKPAAQQQEFTEKERAFLRAAEEERRKRQELERRLAELEKRGQPDTKEPAKTFWDDPDGALARDRESLRAEVSREILAHRLGTSELLARRNHPDFDDKIKVFGEIMQKTPGLYQQFISSLDPGEFAYDLAKQHMEIRDAGSIPELRAKIEKEVRLKLEQELKEKAEALAKEKAALPPSLSDAPGKGNSKVVWGGPPSMDSILRGE